jgi:hypothetical protein
MTLGTTNSTPHNAFQRLLLIDMNVPVFLYALIFTVLSLILTGYRVYYGNQAIQIPLVYSFNDRSLYPNDPFVATLPYYASMLWQVVALGARAINLETLLLVGYLLERLLAICAAGYLARTFAPKSDLAVVGAMAMFALGPEPILGNGTLVVPYFEQTGLSVPFFLLAFAGFYRMSRFWWAVWFAIGFNLNSMYGAYAVTYFLASFLLDSSYREAWKKWVPACALFALLALPAVWFTFAAYQREAADKDLWLAVSQTRFWHHLNPLTWRKLRFVKYGVLTILTLGTLYHYRDQVGKLSRHGSIWTAVSFAWLFYAFLAAYVFKSPAMLVMHPGRGTDLWYCLCAIGLISAFSLAMEQGSETTIPAAVAFLACIALWQPIDHSSLPFLLLAALIAIPWKSVWRYGFCEGSPNRLALVATILVFLISAWAFVTRRSSSEVYEVGFIGRPDPRIEETAKWAEQNTTKDAVFLVDPTWPEFRAVAKRPVFVTLKDGSAILWDRSFVMAWVERMRAIGIGDLKPRESVKELSDRYEGLGDEQVRTLKVQYQVRYWVVSAGHSSSFPVVFERRGVKVLEVK